MKYTFLCLIAASASPSSAASALRVEAAAGARNRRHCIAGSTADQPGRIVPATPANHRVKPSRCINFAPMSRRNALFRSITKLATLYRPACQPALADDKAHLRCSTTNDGSYMSLTDLPALLDDCVRVYFCRHGETIYNRADKIQGARVNAGINELGRRQAKRLGATLQHAAVRPGTVFYSPLLRTQQTAEIAASCWNAQTRALPALTEIDFGDIDGEPVAAYRSALVQTYASWARGDAQYQLAGRGENLAEILKRVQTTMTVLLDAAVKSSSRSVVAVSHSLYLRILLSTICDTPLLLGVARPFDNCAVYVVDVPIDATPIVTSAISPTEGRGREALPGKVGTSRPAAPHTRIVRSNENRHLRDLVAV